MYFISLIYMQIDFLCTPDNIVIKCILATWAPSFTSNTDELQQSITVKGPKILFYLSNLAFQCCIMLC